MYKSTAKLIKQTAASFALAAVFLFPFPGTAQAVTADFDFAAVTPRLSVAERMANHGYPRLASYYLEPIVNEADIPNFSRHDVLILDFEYQHDYPEIFSRVRQENPNAIILAYVPTQNFPIFLNGPSPYTLRKKLREGIKQGWYVRDVNGNKISTWPKTNFLNVSTDWRNHLVNFVHSDILSSGLWDGVFYDELWDGIHHYNGGNIDLDQNGQADDPEYLDRLWEYNTRDLLRQSRERDPEMLIVGNAGNRFPYYLNGRMLETFPTGEGYNWSHAMASYNLIMDNQRTPRLSIINSNTENIGLQFDYKRMRYGLTSALLNDGYYSFDNGTLNHGQTWHYDEYDVDLGQPLGLAYALQQNGKDYKEDFEDGFKKFFAYKPSFESEFLGNLTGDSSAVIEGARSFRAIGDPTEQFNVVIKSRLEQIPLKANTSYKLSFDYKVITQSQAGAFYVAHEGFNSANILQSVNIARFNDLAGGQGSIARVFTTGDVQDSQLYFGVSFDGEVVIDNIVVEEFPVDVYRRDFTKGIVLVNPTNQSQLVQVGKGYHRFAGQQDSVHNSGQPTALVGLNPNDGIILLRDSELTAPTAPTVGQGEINVYPHSAQEQAYAFTKDGVIIKELESKKYVQSNIVENDLNNDGFIEVIEVFNNGAVHIRNKEGRLLVPVFFAWGRGYNSGTLVTIGDVNDNGHNEFILTPKSGAYPVRIYDKDGRLFNSFFPYGEKYAGGIHAAVIDLEGDGRSEFLTVPFKGTTHVKIFNDQARLLTPGFFAVESSYRGGAWLEVK